METTDKIISGKDLMKQYNQLRKQGYRSTWAGNGKICMTLNREKK